MYTYSFAMSQNYSTPILPELFSLIPSFLFEQHKESWILISLIRGPGCRGTFLNAPYSRREVRVYTCLQ